MLPLSYLFVPGNRPERFAKALASGADALVLDLEDAVAPADKAAARQAIAQWAVRAALPAALPVGVRFSATDWVDGGWDVEQSIAFSQALDELGDFDGDVLVLRYTLAYQRDVSSADQENAFCVSMLNGSMNVSHKWQTVTGADGAEQTVCASCGKTCLSKEKPSRSKKRLAKRQRLLPAVL